MASLDSEQGTLLEQVLADYYQSLEDGATPNKTDLLRDHPEIAQQLKEFFANEDRFDRLAAPLRAISPSSGVPNTVASTVDEVPGQPPHTVDYQPANAAAALPGGFTCPTGYEILDRLGHGGMGVVFKARQRGLKRLVALKMIRSGDLADQQHLDRFQIEAETVARVQHPNIVQIHEVGLIDGQPFLAMELVEGGNLASFLAGAPQPAQLAAQLVETLARAMHHSHTCGIVHRDLKPANILLQRADTDNTPATPRDSRVANSKTQTAGSATHSLGTPAGTLVPKVTDFGLAKQLGAEHGHTVTGQILGTPSYMAPEQAQGRSRDVGPAADIYALGAILYECLTGRPPFRGVTKLETVYQVIHSEPVPAGRIQPGVPRDLDTICLRCLQKEPAKRYDSARSLAEDLQRFLSGEPILARPVGALERGYKFARRKPWAAGFLALCGAVLLTALVLPPVLVLTIRQERNEARAEAEANAQQLQETKDRLSLETNQSAVDRHLLEARKNLDGRDFRQAEQHAAEALAIIRQDARLTSIEPAAVELRELAQKKLDGQAAEQEARDRRVRFQRRRDDARFHASQFTSLDVADNVKAVRTAAQEALAMVDVTLDNQGPPTLSPFLKEAQPQIQADCLELLLLWADAEGQPLPRQPPAERAGQARKAVRILQRLEQLGLPATHATHRRLAHFLAVAGEKEAAAQARVRGQELVPKSAVDYYILGLEAFAGEQLETAIKALEETLRQQQDHFGAHYGLAVCYLRLAARTPEQGIAHRVAAKASLTAGLNQKPDSIFLHVLRGFVHSELREFDSAERDFARAEELLAASGADTPRSLRYSLYHNRGNVRIRKNDVDGAIRDLQEALKLHPNPWQAHVSLAQAHETRKDWPQVLDHLGQALQLNPQQAILYRQRARIHELRHDSSAAMADLDKAIALAGASKTALVADDHLQRGSILYRLERYTDALAAFEAALAIRPRHADSQRLRGEALVQLNKHAAAAQAFDRYFEQQGSPVVEVYRARARSRAILGDLPGAIDDYARALDLHADTAVQLQRGWLLLLAEAPRLALRDFSTVLDQNDKNPDAHAGRGNAHVLLGQVDKAVHDAEEAVRLGPKDATLLCKAARIYAQAAGKLEAGPLVDRKVREQIEQYQDRAVQILRQGVEQQPAEKRAAFWRALIQNDPALQPLRRVSGFIDLAKQYNRMID